MSSSWKTKRIISPPPCFNSSVNSYLPTQLYPYFSNFIPQFFSCKLPSTHTEFLEFSQVSLAWPLLHIISFLSKLPVIIENPVQRRCLWETFSTPSDRSNDFLPNAPWSICLSLLAASPAYWNLSRNWANHLAWIKSFNSHFIPPHIFIVTLDIILLLLFIFVFPSNFQEFLLSVDKSW